MNVDALAKLTAAVVAAAGALSFLRLGEERSKQVVAKGTLVGSALLAVLYGGQVVDRQGGAPARVERAHDADHMQEKPEPTNRQSAPGAHPGGPVTLWATTPSPEPVTEYAVLPSVEPVTMYARLPGHG